MKRSTIETRRPGGSGLARTRLSRIPRPAERPCMAMGQASTPDDRAQLLAAVDAEAEQVLAISRWMSDHPELSLEVVADLTATDPSKDDEDLWINVQLLSIAKRHRLAVKCLLPKESAVMPSSTPMPFW